MPTTPLCQSCLKSTVERAVRSTASSSIMCRASLVVLVSKPRRSWLVLSTTPAFSLASSLVWASSMATERLASPMRPAALMRGANPNTRLLIFNSFTPRPASSRRASRPGRWGRWAAR